MVVENKGIITYIRILKEDLEILRIVPDGGTVPEFKAGQFVTLSLPNPDEGKVVRRAYSIASPPEKKNILNY
jgi:ferredoxin/flavodoxin---NADP+ reductase